MLNTAGTTEKFDKLQYKERMKILRSTEKEGSVMVPEIVPTRVNRSPRQHQKDAIEEALKHFAKYDRGQLLLPCGAGKTLTSMWIAEAMAVAEALGGTRSLVMVPSLSLMDQIVKEWANDTKLRPFKYLCLCSDPTVGRKKDEIDGMSVEQLKEDIGSKLVTTDPIVVAEFLRSEPDRPSVLFSTYQSSNVLKEAVRKSKIAFDIALFDEAHRTSGKDSGTWGIALDDRNVPVKKRLFMTATPRLYAAHIKEKAQKDDILLYSMDNPDIYGEPFYEMTWGEAVAKKLICDYKILVISVTDKEVEDLINNNGKVPDGKDYFRAAELAKGVAIAKAMKKYNINKVFTFHNRVKDAEEFVNSNSTTSIDKVFQMLGTDKPELFHVNGSMSAQDRKDRMDRFKKAPNAIMSNAQCLTEGVDVPEVDAIVFMHPKRSVTAIAQAAGRPVRPAIKPDGSKKTKGYICIPVMVKDTDDPDEFLLSDDWDTVAEVLEAMKDQDKRLRDEIFELRSEQGKRDYKKEEHKEEPVNNADLSSEGLHKGIDSLQSVADAKRPAMDTQSNNVEPPKRTDFQPTEDDIKGTGCISNLDILLPQSMKNRGVDITKFIKSLHPKLVTKVSSSWDYGFGQLRAYKEANGDCNVRNVFKTPTGENLGTWVMTQRQAYKKGQLSKDRIDKLEAIGFKWELRGCQTDL